MLLHFGFIVLGALIGYILCALFMVEQRSASIHTPKPLSYKLELIGTGSHTFSVLVKTGEGRQIIGAHSTEIPGMIERHGTNQILSFDF